MASARLWKRLFASGVTLTLYDIVVAPSLALHTYTHQESPEWMSHATALPGDRANSATSANGSGAEQVPPFDNPDSNFLVSCLHPRDILTSFFGLRF